MLTQILLFVQVVAYTAYLVLGAQEHEHLPAFSGIMLGYVLPLTVIGLVVSFVRANGKTSGKREEPDAG